MTETPSKPETEAWHQAWRQAETRARQIENSKANLISQAFMMRARVVIFMISLSRAR